MTPQEKKSLSKKLALGLRHRPEVFGLELDAQGWCEVDQLLTAFNAQGITIDRSDLEEIVFTNDKKRFAFSQDGLSLRASQGHSIEIDLGYTPLVPPKVLYHGTASKNIISIQAQGLLRGKRQQVHLSTNKDTATVVGARHGKAVVLLVDAQKMYADGFLFYCSVNGVWLTERVPVMYLTF